MRAIRKFTFPASGSRVTQSQINGTRARAKWAFRVALAAMLTFSGLAVTTPAHAAYEPPIPTECGTGTQSRFLVQDAWQQESHFRNQPDGTLGSQRNLYRNPGVFEYEAVLPGQTVGVADSMGAPREVTNITTATMGTYANETEAVADYASNSRAANSDVFHNILLLEGAPGSTATYTLTAGDLNQEFNWWWFEDASGVVQGSSDGWMSTWESDAHNAPNDGATFTVTVTFPADGKLYFNNVNADPSRFGSMMQLNGYECPVPPTAAPDEATTPFNTPVDVPLLGNDDGVDSPIVPADTTFLNDAGLPVDTLTVAGEGTWTINDDGVATFTPEAGFTGTTTPVDYQITTEDGDTATSTVTVTVEPAPNEQPTANPDEATTPFNTPVDVPLLGNDDGVDSPIVPADTTFLNDAGLPVDTLTVAGEGTWTINDDGVATFTPEAGFTGTTTPVDYQITTEDGDTATSTVTVTVEPAPNEQPTANPDEATTPFNTPVDVPLLGNDDGVDSPIVPADTTFLNDAGLPVDTLTVAGEGTWTINDDGVATFTPEAGFTGTTTPVDYQITTEDGDTATSTVTVTVEPAPNEQPTANPDEATTPFNTPVDVPLLGNDDGVDSPIVPADTTFLNDAGLPVDTLTVAGEGTWTINDDGVATFTPEAGFTGTTTPVDYQITTEDGDTATSTVTVTVEPAPNEQPTANPDEATTPFNTPVDVPLLGNDDGVDSPIVPADTTFLNDAGLPVDTLTVAGEGTWTINDDGVATFTPEAGFTGTTTPVDYQITTEDGDTATSTVTVTVEPAPNEQPTANPDEATTPFNTPVDVPLLGNDDGVDSPIVPADTTFLNDAGLPVDTLTVAGEGTWTINDDGVATFTPEAGFTGTTTPVDYQITTEDGDTATSTVTVTVEPAPNEQPTANPDEATTPFNTPVDVPLLGNDDGVDSPIVPADTTFLNDAGLPVDTLTVAGEGTWTINDDGVATFTPEAGFTGTTTPVDYQITTEDGDTATSTVTVTVEPAPNEQPTANPDEATTPFNTPVDVPLLGNDDGVDSPIVPADTTFLNDAGLPVDTLTVAGEGTWTINDDGVATFTPEAGFTGTTTPVDYQITTEDGDTATSTVTVTVEPAPNEQPTANPDEATTPFNTPVDVPLLGNDDGVDSPIVPADTTFLNDAGLPVDTLTVAGEGTWTINDDGVATFTPEAGFTGTTTPVDYQITTEDGDTATSTVTVTVEPAPNEQPTANPDEATTPFNTPVDVPLLGNDDGVDSPIVPADTTFLNDAGLPVDTLTVAGEGTWTINDDGVATFTPEAGFTGTTTPVDYQITTEDGDTATSTVTVTVEPAPNEQPTANPDEATTPFNTPVDVPLLGNDDGVDSPIVPADTTFLNDAGLPVDTLTVAGEGTWTINDDGVATFTPEAGFTGTTTPVDYQITTEDGDTATSTVTVTVEPAPNEPPTANPDEDTTTPGTPVDIPVLDNDESGDSPIVPGETTLLDENGNPVDELVVPGEGTWTVNDEGVITFTPEPGFTGTTTPVDYQITTEDGDTAVSTVTVTVTGDPGPDTPGPDTPGPDGTDPDGTAPDTADPDNTDPENPSIPTGSADSGGLGLWYIAGGLMLMLLGSAGGFVFMRRFRGEQALSTW